MEDNGRPQTWFERSGYGSRRAEVNLVSALFLIFAFITLFLNQELDLSFTVSDPLGLEDVMLTNTQGALALIALFCFFFSSLIVFVSSIYSTGVFSGERDPMAFVLFLVVLFFPLGFVYAYYWWTFGNIRSGDRMNGIGAAIDIGLTLLLLLWVVAIFL
jgi:hypothetical protein